jgi:RNase P/RNase MRP subunit p29
MVVTKGEKTVMNVVAGKYRGCKGIVVRETAKMIVIRLLDNDVEVRLWKSSVEQIEVGIEKAVDNKAHSEELSVKEVVEKEIQELEKRLEKLTVLVKWLKSEEL